MEQFKRACVAYIRGLTERNILSYVLEMSRNLSYQWIFLC